MRGNEAEAGCASCGDREVAGWCQHVRRYNLGEWRCGAAKGGFSRCAAEWSPADRCGCKYSHNCCVQWNSYEDSAAIPPSCSKSVPPI
jgi:hypothetical protein